MAEVDVSIHAPVKGATRRAEAGRREQGVSIHAPVKGATPLSIMDPSYDLLVSIHAPVKGATGVGRGSTTSLV